MKNLCTIGARGGSEGLPEKNLKIFCGKPLIVWSIEQALETPEINSVIVSTDSPNIAEVAISAGANVPFLRPENLSSSEVGKFQVWQHVLEYCSKNNNIEYEYLVDLDCTNPLRDSSDISAAIALYNKRASDGVDAVFSVCPARKNPYFNLVEPNKNGSLRISKETPGNVVRRQDSPLVFEHVASIYVLSPEYLRTANHLLDGNVIGYNIGVEKSLDIDSEFDFQLVEFLFKKNRGYK